MCVNVVLVTKYFHQNSVRNSWTLHGNLISPPFSLLQVSSALFPPCHSWEEHKYDWVSSVFTGCFPCLPPVYGSIQSVYYRSVSTRLSQRAVGSTPALHVHPCVATKARDRKTSHTWPIPNIWWLQLFFTSSVLHERIRREQEKWKPLCPLPSVHLQWCGCRGIRQTSETPTQQSFQASEWSRHWLNSVVLFFVICSRNGTRNPEE